MATYVAMGVQFFDGEEEWAKGNANWVKENTEALAQQSTLVSPGAMAELTSWFGSFEVLDDGTMKLVSAWHLDENGDVQTGLPEDPELPDPEDPENPEEPDPEDPEDPEESYPAWQEWDGNNANLYQIGDRVSHNGSNWEAVNGDNHWEPGEFGWVEI